MPQLTHEQFDQKIKGLAAAYTALQGLDLTAEGLTAGQFDNDVHYGYRGKIYDNDTFNIDLTRGVSKGLESLRFSVGCWGRLTHDSSILIDEASTDERLRMAGVLAMMTAPEDQEKFDGVALTIYELLDNIAQGNNVVVVRPGELRYVDGEWKDDVQETGRHNGKLQATFKNGQIGSRVISIWSDRPDNIHPDTPDERGLRRQIVFPLLTVDLDELAKGKVQIQYPPANNVAV